MARGAGIRIMSVYALNKICRDALHDQAFRAELARDPAAAIANCDLTDDERALFLAGDVARLYELGVHSFLMSHLTRWGLLGLTTEVYSERIRPAHDPR